MLASSTPLARKLHPIFAYTLLGVAVMHVVGVIWHVVRHRENLPMSMVDGKKAAAANAPSQAIRSSYPIAAVVLERTRYRSLHAEATGAGHGPGGGEPGPLEPRFRPTDERFVDPTTSVPMHVWADPATGERRYVPDR